MRSRGVFAVLGLFVIALVGAGCGRGKGKINLTLTAVPSGTASLTVRESNPDYSLVGDSSQRNMVSFTPTSILVPIRKFSLSKGVSDSDIYSCGGDESECYVDLANQASLDNLANSAKINEGSYDSFKFSLCVDYGMFHYKVKGSVEINGKTYYTTGDGSVLSTDSNKFDYTTIAVNGSGGCGLSKIAIPGGIKIKDGDSKSISIFVVVKNMAFAGPITAAVGAASCVNSTDNSMATCLNLPNLAPYLYATAPTLETYRIKHPDGGHGQLLLLFDSADAFIGGFAQQFYDGIVAGNTGYSTAIQTFSKNDNGTYFIQTYGGGSPAQGPIDHLMTFPNFQRTQHSGTLSGWDAVAYRYTDSIAYTASKN